MIPRALTSSNSTEHYTPARYVSAVHDVLEWIDLDPASCELANRTVHARKFYSLKDDGLSKPWKGRVFLNPPYGKTKDGETSAKVWVYRLIREYLTGNVREAIFLVHAKTGEKWFQPFWDYPLCFTRRIQFDTPSGVGEHPPQGSAFGYLGLRLSRFTDAFREHGKVVIPHRSSHISIG